MRGRNFVSVIAERQGIGIAGQHMMGILFASDESDGPAGSSAANCDSHGKPKGDLVFDGWLNHHLSQLYGPVIDEPISAELLRRIEEQFK